MVQHVAIIKLISPLKGGTCIEIIPLLVQIFFVPIDIIIAITELVDNNDKFVKEQVELVDPWFIILNSGVGPLEFLSTSLSLTPHQIGIG